MNADNMGGILISKREGISDRTRHCAVEAHVLQNAVDENFVEFFYVPTNLNIAEVLTKILSSPCTRKFAYAMGLYVN